MIYKRGNIYWCEFTIDGKRYRYSCQTADKRIAESVENSIRGEVVRDKYNLPLKHKPEILFDDTFNNYIENQITAQSTITRSKNAAKHFLPFFKNKPIQNITTDQIESYQLKRKLEILSTLKNKNKRENEISFKSINIETGVLSNFFNFCIKKGYIDKNFCTGIKKLNTLSRIKTLSDEDIEKLINGATNKLTKDLISFLIFTGCRKGEALNLKWDDVDIQNNVIAIKGTKTKYDRYIPVSKPLKELLNGVERKADCLYVFNKNGVKISNFRKSFITACRNAGIKDLHIHDLRHVFASKMVMNGTSLYITGELLGHRTTQMTKRYSHLVPETLKKAVDDVWGRK